MRTLPLLAAALVVGGCGAHNADQSNPTAVDLIHSRPKWQSIGNCWAYAVVGWVEGMIMRFNDTPDDEPNFSETYITYRHFEEQLRGAGPLTELETAGSWYRARALILRYGLMHEGDFVANEAYEDKSFVQENALKILNESLKTGPLSLSRDSATVRAELDRAFGVKLGLLASRIVPARRISLGTEPRTNRRMTLVDELNNWNVIAWNPNRSSDLTAPAGPFPVVDANNRRLLQRVLKALNSGHPVMLSWGVDFNAMDDTGRFSLETLRSKAAAGTQGGHLTVLEDYLAQYKLSNGTVRTVGEGQASALDLAQIESRGTVTEFVVKNSWGSENRTDRPSGWHDGRRGFHHLAMSYLLGTIPWKDKEGEVTSSKATLWGFVVPQTMRPTPPPPRATTVRMVCQVNSPDGKANVRSFPRGTIIDELRNGQLVLGLRQSGRWLSVQFRRNGVMPGTSAWIHDSLLTCVDTSFFRTAPDVTDAEASVCMVQSPDGKATVRHAPGGAARHVLFNGDRITLLEKNDGWARVRFLKERGVYGFTPRETLWIPDSQLKCGSG